MQSYRLQLIILIALLRYQIAWQAAHAANAKLTAAISREASDLLGLARWVYRKHPELAHVSAREAKVFSVQQALAIRDRKTGRTASRRGWLITDQYTKAAESAVRAPLVPSWESYEPLVSPVVGAAHDLAREAYRLNSADLAVIAIAAFQRAEAWIVDIAMSDDRTASTWVDERTVEEQIDEAEELKAYREALDATVHGKYEDRMQMRMWGRKTGTEVALDVIVEGEDVSGYRLEEWSDATTDPVMVASDLGEGIHAVIAAERRSAPGRLRPGFQKAMPVLAALSDARRELEDTLLFGREEETTSSPKVSEEVVRITAADVPRLRAEWLKASEEERASLARYGRLAAWLARAQAAYLDRPPASTALYLPPQAERLQRLADAVRDAKPHLPFEPEPDADPATHDWRARLVRYRQLTPPQRDWMRPDSGTLIRVRYYGPAHDLRRAGGALSRPVKGEQPVNRVHPHPKPVLVMREHKAHRRLTNAAVNRDISRDYLRELIG